jgi:hypothetical protein
MKRTIRLNESELRHMIAESVKRILRETSTDTIDSATEKAKEKYEQYFNRYGENDPRTQQAYSQYVKFSNKWDSEYDKGNVARQARMLTNREKRQSGERTYVNGTGWRNNDYKNNDEKINQHTEPSENEKFITFLDAKKDLPKNPRILDLILLDVGEYLETYQTDADKILYVFDNSDVEKITIQAFGRTVNGVRLPKSLIGELKKYFRFAVKSV